MPNKSYRYCLLYLFSIVVANVITASLLPVQLGVFIVPAGTFIVGATFVLRDLVQLHIGRRATYLVVCVALIISAATSYLLGDTLLITLASALSFALSETIDTEIYSRIKASFARRVLISGLFGGTVDSAIFVIVGLSPLGAGFLPWSAVPAVILGQILVKGVMQVVGALIISKLNGGMSNGTR